MNLNFTPCKKCVFLIVLILLVSTAIRAQVKSQSAAQSQTAPDQTGGPQAQATRLLQKNLGPAGLSQTDLNSYFVTDAYADRKTGLFMVYLQQTYAGIPVYRKIGVFVFRNDTLVSGTTNYIPVQLRAAGLLTTPGIDPARAIRAAAAHLLLPTPQEPRLLNRVALRQHFVYSGAGVSREQIPTDLVWLPVDSTKKVRLAWNLRIVTPDGNGDWWIRVDAQTGEVIDKSSLIVSEKNRNDCDPVANPAPLPGFPAAPAKMAAPKKEAAPAKMAAPKKGSSSGFFGTPAATGGSYRVYPFPIESANYGNRVLDLNPWLRAGGGNDATTLGWHYDNNNDYSFTRGNNVWALTDFDGSSQFTGYSDTSTTILPSLTFDQPVDTSLTAQGRNNVHGGLDNLFYWNNIMHDISYQYGFDEAGGNFQTSNMSRGGVENDMVVAFTQDGAGINNSDFSTPPDGFNPRMRMFLFDLTKTSKLHITAPAGIVGDYGAIEGDFSYQSRLADKGPITGGIVYLTDVNSTHLSCVAASTTPNVSGKIAMLDRGTCNFTTKVKNAQTAGAIAVIVVQSSGAATGMSGTDTTIKIPAVMISQSDGATLKANLTGLNGTLSTGGTYRDGSVDNGVIAHEYTHGISNRLTGGPANVDCLSNLEQMGEGWSDYMALMVTTDWSTAAVTDGTKKRPLGTYVFAQPATGGGIRTYPYSTDMSVNPWTYGMLSSIVGGEVHQIGEIWCATLWDMTWNIVQQEGIDADIYNGTKGNNIALQLVMMGLKLQPCSPGFIDGRDAILKADSLLYGNRHKCAIWNAFARRGMGKSASQGSSDNYQDQTAATDLPSGVSLSTAASKTLLAQGDNVTYTLTASCDCQALSGINIVDTLSSNMSYVSSTGGNGGTFTSPAVHWDNNSFTAGEIKTFTVTASVTGTYATPDTVINSDLETHNYPFGTTSSAGNVFTSTTTRAHGGTHSWYAKDPATLTSYTLFSNPIIPGTVSTLSFWHYYSTESTFDGGVVEISTDNGVTWQDLGPYMTQNGYNSSIDPGFFRAGWPSTASSLANRNAFTGSSGGQFVQTSVSLGSFAGKTALIRFRFASDNVNGGDGWYIDDILLTNETGTTSTSRSFSGATLLSSSILSSKFAVAPLPVNFLSFEAKKINGSSQLHWTVNSEIDAEKYVIERSTDGAAYTAIGEVPAANSGDYTFTDDRPVDGRDYYRIREQDFDGEPTLSVIKVLQFNTRSFVVRLSPVPTYTHSVQLEIDADNNKPVTATLLSMTGQTLKVFVVRPGTNQLNLDNFSKGMYFLRIETNTDDAQIRKLIIQ